MLPATRSMDEDEPEMEEDEEQVDEDGVDMSTMESEIIEDQGTGMTLAGPSKHLKAVLFSSVLPSY
jgi:hypothetical protein